MVLYGRARQQQQKKTLCFFQHILRVVDFKSYQSSHFFAAARCQATPFTRRRIRGGGRESKKMRQKKKMQQMKQWWGLGGVLNKK